MISPHFEFVTVPQHALHPDHRQQRCVIHALRLKRESDRPEHVHTSQSGSSSSDIGVNVSGGNHSNGGTGSGSAVNMKVVKDDEKEAKKRRKKDKKKKKEKKTKKDKKDKKKSKKDKKNRKRKRDEEEVGEEKETSATHNDGGEDDDTDMKTASMETELATSTASTVEAPPAHADTRAPTGNVVKDEMVETKEEKGRRRKREKKKRQKLKKQMNKKLKLSEGADASTSV